MQTFKAVKDSEGKWLAQSFLMPRFRTSQLQNSRRRYGDVRYKFTDTRLGGMHTMNAPPQACQFADIRKSGLNHDVTPTKWQSAKGMGISYSKILDDNAERVVLRAGVPKFNSLTTFFTGFYNSEASLLARTGRVPGIFYNTGKVAGLALSLPFLPVILGFSIARWAGFKPATQYYYFESAMALFWNRLNMLLNHLAPALRMNETPISENTRRYLDDMGNGDQVGLIANDQARNQVIHSIMPDLFREDGTIDIYRISTRAARMEYQAQEQFRKMLEDEEIGEPLFKRFDKYLHEDKSRFYDPGGRSMEEAFKAYAESQSGKVAVGDNEDNKARSDSEGGRAYSKPNDQGGYDTEPGWWAEFFDHHEANARDGSEFIAFDIDKVETTTETFSNSVRDSDIGTNINSISSNARNKRFNFAEGNLADGGILNLGEKVVNTLKDTVVGVADGLQMSGMFALAGTAFADIPKHWENSEVSLPSSNYSLSLRSIRHDKYSILTKLFIPSLALVSMAAPTSTGASSYFSPMLVQCYHKGKGQVRNGMITSLSITRGAGSVGWTKDYLPLGLDINFTVTDMTSIMHLPLADTTGIKNLSIFDEESKLNDYIAVMGSLSVADQIYFRNRLMLSYRRSVANFRSWTSPAQWASWFNGTDIGRLINMAHRELDRPF